MFYEGRILFKYTTFYIFMLLYFPFPQQQQHLPQTIFIKDQQDSFSSGTKHLKGIHSDLGSVF